MFFVAGITGHVGGATTRELLAQGKKVRTLARDPKKASAWADQGVEVRQGDWTDTAALASALEGVEGAYLMLPPIMTPKPGFPEAKAVIASYKEALTQVQPPRVVFLSSIGSEQAEKLGLITSTHLLEEAMADVRFPVAFVRAGSFFENYVPTLDVAAGTGVFYSFVQPVDLQVPMIATEDIGKEVARLLVSEWSGKRIIELGSPVTPKELADAIGEVVGRPVQAQVVPREAWTKTMESFGFPAGGTGAYEEMQDSINSGWIHFGVPGTEAVAGTLTAKQVYEKARKG